MTLDLDSVVDVVVGVLLEELPLCPGCWARVQPAADPVLVCRCGTSLVVLRIAGVWYAFARAELPPADEFVEGWR